MSEREVLPKFPLPAHRVYHPDTLDDYDLEAQVVVEPTGFFGRGIPIFIADECAGYTPEEGQRTITIRSGQVLYVPPEHTADAWVRGRWLSVAQADLKDSEPKNADLDS